MSTYGDNSLSLEQTVELLPTDFAPVVITDRKRQLATSSKGLIALRSSRDYFPATWWTSFKPELLETEVKYVIIALGYSGILVIPSHVILDFGRKFAVSKLKNGRQNIRIKKEDSKLVMYEPGAPTVDLTGYFIPAKPPRTYPYHFSKFRVSLFTLCDTPNEEVSFSTVRKFVSETIQRTLDAGENPFRQAHDVDVHTLSSWNIHIPSVSSEEEMYDTRNQETLAAWIMDTDEMQEALNMFRGKKPTDTDDPECSAWEMDDEAVYEIQIDQLLAYLIPSEGDWQ